MSQSRTLHRPSLFTVAALLALAGTAHATNGYFSHGYGIRAKGMGGASLAVTGDAFGGANNPATMVWAGNQLDLGLDLFMPKRDMTRSGAGFPPINGSVDSDKTAFYVPELAYNRMLGADQSIGLTVYGNGGLNTDYPQGSFQCPASPTTTFPANALCGQGRLGVDMMQLMIAPTWSMKLAGGTQSIGVAPLLGYQRFKATGLQAFDNPPGFPPFTGAPGSVTDNGYDSSTGLGLRLGWLAQPTSSVKVGASYATRMHMGQFDKYKGLFAEGGGFDVPANYGLGLSVLVSPTVMVAADYTRIAYSKIASIGNASSNQAPLGAANGPGFGWKDVGVLKLGVEWKAQADLTVRAGFNKGDNPIRSSDVSFNILAPGVITTHYTLGGTLAVGPKDEVSGAFMLAPRQSVSGGSLFNSPALLNGAGGSETIRMRQTSLGMAWTHRF
jgi:long-chain fatty acid transport protein